MNSHGITNWQASNSEIEIVVVSSPFSMTKRYVWKHHTENHYGQGMKWQWWSMFDGKLNGEVHSKEAEELLTYLVNKHEILSKIAHHYHIPLLVDEVDE